MTRQLSITSIWEAKSRKGWSTDSASEDSEPSEELSSSAGRDRSGRGGREHRHARDLSHPGNAM